MATKIASEVSLTKSRGHGFKDRVLPLTIRPTEGAFCIENANRRPISYSCFKDDGLATSTHCSKKRAREIAQVIARVMTDRLVG